MFRKLGPQPQPCSLYINEVHDFIRVGLKKFTDVDDHLHREFLELTNNIWQELQEKLRDNENIDFNSLNPVFLKVKITILQNVYFVFKNAIADTGTYLRKLLVIKYKLDKEIQENSNIWGDDIFEITRDYKTARPN